MQRINETVIMKIGKTSNGKVVVTEDSIRNVLDRIVDVPIIYNRGQQFKNYNQDLQTEYLDKLPIIGRVIGNAKIIRNKLWGVQFGK